MSRRNEKYSLYLIPIFFGIVAFLNSNFLPYTLSSNADESIIIGINLFTLIFLILIAILVYTLLPKHNLTIKTIRLLIKLFFKKNIAENNKIDKFQKQLDCILSSIVYYLFTIIIIIFTIVGVIQFIDTI